MLRQENKTLCYLLMTMDCLHAVWVKYPRMSRICHELDYFFQRWRELCAINGPVCLPVCTKLNANVFSGIVGVTSSTS